MLLIRVASCLVIEHHLQLQSNDRHRMLARICRARTKTMASVSVAHLALVALAVPLGLNPALTVDLDLVSGFEQAGVGVETQGCRTPLSTLWG